MAIDSCPLDFDDDGFFFFRVIFWMSTYTR